MTIQEQSLNKRLNGLESFSAEEDQVLNDINPIMDKQEFTEDVPVDQEIVNPTEPVFAQTEEDIKVAGPIKAAGEAIKKILPKENEEFATLIKKRSEMGGDSNGYVIIPNATERDFEDVMKNLPDQPVTGAAGDAKIVGGKQKRITFNVNQIQDADGVKQFMNAVGDAYVGEKKVISTKQIADELTRSRYTVYQDGKSFKQFGTQDEADAFIASQKDPTQFKVESKAPYSSEYIARILDPNNPTIADPTEVYKMLMAQLDATNRTEMLARRLIEAEAKGTATDAMRIEFDQSLALTGEISKAVEGRTADIGRSLRMFGEARTGDKNQMRDFIASLGDGSVTGSEDRAQKFLALGPTDQKAKIAQNAFNFDNAYTITKDIWLSTWINGLLSSPVTHLKNMASNFTFGVYSIPERYVTSIVGKARNKYLGGSDDYLRVKSVNTLAYTYFTSFIDSARVAGKAFKNNATLEGGSKLELDKMSRRNEFDVDFGDSDFAKASSNALKMYGKFVTLPGRALLAEDEFFKAATFISESKMLINNKAEQFYDDLIRQGVDINVAEQRKADFLTDMMANPPKDIMQQAIDKSHEMTFTKDLDGVMAKVQTLSNEHPLLKMFIPFVRTPTNLVIEATKRTPLQFMRPSFYKAVKAGGVEGDAALAKAVLGSTMIGTFGYMGLDGSMTGSGPANIQQRKTLEATGWMPYSIVFNKGDLSDAELEEFRTMTPVSVGDDKVYVSYQGLQPVSTLLAIGSSIGEFSTYSSYVANQDKDTYDQIGQLMMISAMSIYEHVSELPMLQGYTEMTEILSGDPMSRKNGFMNALRKITKKVSDVAIGGSPVGAYSSALNTVERTIDPEKRSTLPRGEEGRIEHTFNPLDDIYAGWQQSVNQYMSKSPFFSASAEPVLDPMTAEPVTVGKGNWGAMFNPFKNSEGNVDPVYYELLKNGVPVYNPPKRIHGYELSAEQYNAWIEIAVIEQDLGDRVISMSSALDGDEDLGKVQRSIRKEMTDAYSEAFEKLVEFYPDIQDYMQDKDVQTEIEGIYSYY